MSRLGVTKSRRLSKGPRTPWKSTDMSIYAYDWTLFFFLKKRSSLTQRPT